MDYPYELRAIRAEEFEAWARTIAHSYGEDLHPVDLEHQRSAVELDRTIAVFDGDALVAGAAIFSRTMTFSGATQPVAAVTLVGVEPTYRRRGIMTEMMRRQLTALHESAGEAVAVLNASEATIYERFGYGIASRAARILGDKRSMRFRPDVNLGPGRVRLVDRDDARPLLEKVYDTVRTDSVGWLDRPPTFWDARLEDAEHVRPGATRLRFAFYEEQGGELTGYAMYRLQGATYVQWQMSSPAWEESALSGNEGTVQVAELATRNPHAYAALWRYLVDIDLHPRISYEGAVDEALPHLLLDPRGVRSTVVDRLWVRLVDVPRALASRSYAAPLDTIIEVDDAFCPWNAGRYRLQAEGESVVCERTGARPDLALSSTELGAIYLGGTTLASLAVAGRVRELQPGAVATCTLAFRGQREPVCPAGASFPAY